MNSDRNRSMSLKARKEKDPFKMNLVDRVVNYLSPGRGVARVRARGMLNVFETISKRPKKGSGILPGWEVTDGDANADLTNLPDFREASRDLVRTNPLAAGALNTKCTNIIGSGLILQSQVDRRVLGWSKEQAREWQRHTEAEFRLFSESQNCDASGTQNLYGMMDLAYRSSIENGDVITLLPMLQKALPGSPYRLQAQLVEADRLCNEDNALDSENLAQGVEKDPNTGRPKKYHIRTRHPGSDHVSKAKWNKIDAYGKLSGRKNVIHFFMKRRVGQSRGVPDFAPVIALFKMLGRYTDAEVKSAVIQSFFTVFFKTEDPNGGLRPMQPTGTIGGKADDEDYKLGSGAMLDLKPGETLEFADPSRPGGQFDPFVLAVLRQIGVCLELPFEILVKHFTASYSAAKAAIEEAWRFYMRERRRFVDNWIRHIYEAWMDEAVSVGRIVAPGFINGDPLLRSAYLGSTWTGPIKTQLDEKKAVDAAVVRVENGFSTRGEETVGLTGGDWEMKNDTRITEEEMREPLKEKETPATPVVPVQPEDPPGADPGAGDPD